MSQQAVADKVGVSRVAVTKWESGMTANLKLGNLMSLCDLFGVSVEELVLGVGAAKTGAGEPKVREPNPEDVGGAWDAYCSAGEKTRAAVDLLLTPEEDRESIGKQAQLAIEVLEELAPQVIAERKKTRAA